MTGESLISWPKSCCITELLPQRSFPVYKMRWSAFPERVLFFLAAVFVTVAFCFVGNVHLTLWAVLPVATFCSVCRKCAI